MLRNLVKELNVYLNCKGGLNYQEEKLRELCNACKSIYPISCLTREDLEEKGYDTSSLSDKQMERLAGKMGDNYVENYFHESLDLLAILHHIPQKKN